MSKNRVKNCIMAAVLIIGAISFKAGISPVAKLWKFSFEKIDEAISESKDNDDEKQTYHEAEPDPLKYSETLDTDGDGIPDRHEIYMGLDPEDQMTGGTWDMYKVISQHAEYPTEDYFAPVLYVDTESSGYIYSELTVQEYSESDLYTDDRMGRVVTVDNKEFLFGSTVNQYAFASSVMEVKYNPDKLLDKITVGFKFPDYVNAGEYVIFKRKVYTKDDIQYDMLTKVKTEYSDSEVWYTDSEAAEDEYGGVYVLVDLKKYNDFFELVNHRSPDLNNMLAPVPADEIIKYDFSFITPPQNSRNYSEYNDSDGDGISDLREFYLGMDPEKSDIDTEGNFSTVFFQNADQNMMSEFNLSHNSYNFSMGIVCDWDAKKVSVAESQYTELLSDDRNGRRAVKHDYNGANYEEAFFNGTVHPSVIVSDIIDINFPEGKNAEEINVSFTLPDDIPESEIEDYTVAYYLPKGKAQQTVGYMNYIPGSYDGRRVSAVLKYDGAVALINLKKLREFAVAENGVPLNDEVYVISEGALGKYQFEKKQ